jgi:hypothetical protein
MPNGQVDDAVANRYIHNLAQVIKYQLSASSVTPERQLSAQSAQNRTWSSQTEQISQVYFHAINEHKRACKK